MSIREAAQNKMHHKGKRFVNPLGVKKQGGIHKVIYWKLFARNRHKEFYPDEQVKPVTIDWGQIRQHDGLSVTFIRHATIMVKDKGEYLLIDPVFFGIIINSVPLRGIVGGLKDFSPITFGPSEMPAPNHVLITHDHYDHLNKPSLSLLDNDTHIITPLGNGHIFDALDMNNRTQLDWYDKYSENGREITLLPSNHWTIRNPFLGPNRSLWGSYLIKTSHGPVIYVSGDTAYFEEMEEIGRDYDIDLAIINLGAYEPRWFMKDSHINPEETVRAFQKLGAKKLMVVHWGTFRLGDEPVHFPPIDIRTAMEKAEISNSLVHLNPGETLFM